MIWCYLLAGGRSSRFGSDKAAADWDGRTFLQAGCDTFRAMACADRVAVVVSPASPVPAVDCDGVVRDRSDASHRHPLLGLVAAIRHAADVQASTAVVAAVDQPFLQPAWLEALIDAAQEHSSAAYRGAFWQPFPVAVNGAVLSDVADELDRMLDTEDRDQLSIQRCYRELRVHSLPLPEGWPTEGGSVNTPAERDAMRRRKGD